jgi:hypothetical protein
LARSRDRRTRPGQLVEPGRARLPPAAEPEAPPLSITLRDVEVPPPEPAADAPADEELVRSDPEARPVPWLGDPQADRAAQRAARRAQVRRDRVRDREPATPSATVTATPSAAVTASATATASAPNAAELLVLCAAEADCGELCTLLRNFGFAVRVMPAPPALAAPWPHGAVFVAMTMRTGDGGDAIDLCSQVRENSRLPGTLKPVLVLVAEQLSATDRVRAGLAGCNEILLGPATRGSVARVLEARGVALPSDARRV